MGPAVHEGKVYFGSWDCRLHCVSAETGGLLWEFKTSLGYGSEVDVDSELGETSFELIIPESLPSMEEEKYKPKEAKELSEYQTSGDMVYQSDTGYKSRRKYGAI